MEQLTVEKRVFVDYLAFHYQTEPVVGLHQVLVVSLIGLAHQFLELAIRKGLFGCVGEYRVFHLAVAFDVEHDRDDEPHVDDGQFSLNYVLCLLKSPHMNHKLVLLLLKPLPDVLQMFLQILEKACSRRVEDDPLSNTLDFHRILKKKHDSHTNRIVEFFLGVVVERDHLVHLLDNGLVLHIYEKPTDVRDEFCEVTDGWDELHELSCAPYFAESLAESGSVYILTLPHHSRIG
jgi:hypothetical protein